MHIVNNNPARTGCHATSPYCIDLQEDFRLDPASMDVIDAPGWIPTGSHSGSVMQHYGNAYLIAGEDLRSLWV